MDALAKYPRATTITIYSLGISLGLLHIFFGASGLSPIISQDYHRLMKSDFNKLSAKLTFLHGFLNKAILAEYLRFFVSTFQVIFGALLVENGYFSGILGMVGNYGLIILDLVFIIFQIYTGTPYERFGPAVVFFIFLVARLVIVQQSSKKTKVGVKTRNSGKPKTSTPKKNKNE